MNTTRQNMDLKQPLSICRCCRADGCCKDISSEYFFSGQREVYQDMLKDTFNIQMVNTENREPNNSKHLICEDCIVRLRDAYTFKRIVVRSEEIFADCLESLQYVQDKGNKILNTEINLDSVKVEAHPLQLEDETAGDDGRIGEEFRDDGSLDDDEILSNIKLELTKTNDQTILEPPTNIRKKKQGRKPKKRSKIKDKYDKKIDELNSDTKAEKNWIKIAERRGNGPILRENSLKLIKNSTICVFQWNKSRYRCFCCKEPFSDMNLLKEHTKTHTLENIEKKIIIQQNRLVKVEVSDLYCKICQSELENLISLRSHLSKVHDVIFELAEDLLVPFKIRNGDLQCQICSEMFTRFRLLNIHMNRHYQKQVCHICGAGFSNLVFLNLHKTRSHRPFTCKECDLVFKNRTDKKDHDITVHNVKFERKLRFPCPYCHERFFQENFRVQHLVEKHGMSKPEHKCGMCSKVFITRSLCNNHVKNVHMKEKNQECDLCHNFFYTKSDVARHRVTHTGEKKFSCTFCGSLFATKDSLRRHMKRTHVTGNGT